jgi:hypothetical protein
MEAVRAQSDDEDQMPSDPFHQLQADQLQDPQQVQSLKQLEDPQANQAEVVKTPR